MAESSKKSSIKKYFQSVFNVRAWADWDRFRNTSNYFLKVFRRLFVIQTPSESEKKTFDEVIASLGLTEEALMKQQKGLKIQWILMLCLAAGFYVYAMYELLYGGFLSTMLSIVIIFVILALAFRYHFWYFQIKKRRLGCSLSEWFSATFMKGGDA